jgi:Protein of unknown function (DUF3048) N-terminal domain/Protein of unknown function (DUF3048) C-terminal domain
MAVRRLYVVLAALLVLVAVVTAGLLASRDHRAGRSSSPGTGSGAVSPFTGEEGRRGPVLAVKVDNVAAARPQTGLGRADIVYAEQVEGGQSRLMAIFSSHQPRTVGPVRSARQSDLELLRQFGHPALAYSGAQSRLLPLLRAAPVENVTPDNVPEAFFRGSGRPAPHNLFVRPGRALDSAPDASRARDIGFRFGQAPSGGHPTAQRSLRYPAARFSFTWSAGTHRWLVSMDGRSARTTDGGRLGAATVVIQSVTVRPSRFHDRSGNVSPFTETVGSGSATVLRGGRAFDAHWSRPDASGGTAFTTRDGSPLRFARGPVWVVFTPR